MNHLRSHHPKHQNNNCKEFPLFANARWTEVTSDSYKLAICWVFCKDRIVVKTKLQIIYKENCAMEFVFKSNMAGAKATCLQAWHCLASACLKARGS